MNIKSILNQFRLLPPFRLGFKSAFSDLVVVMIAVALSALMMYVTSENDAWMPFVSYVTALVLLVVGMLVSWLSPSRFWPFIFSNSIMALLCVTASVDAVKAVATYVLNTDYRDTPLRDVPSFVLNNASVAVPSYMVFFAILYVFVVMFSYRWFDEVQRHKRTQNGKITIACD
ncbi:hypothetical protein [Pseudomonas alkylphenolica]|uniref:hypothetical protein n=1 Tax=Pseudomonas alkylphenolica TaxID=237609 RepID=UPI000F9642C6